MKSFVRLLVVVAVVVVAGGFVVTNYSWVFAKRVKGKILDVKRVTDPTAIISSKITAEQLHSYSVLIEGDDGKLYTASTEDRQWEVAAKGYCVEALLYRYPPWDFDRANTFFNARLVELSRCDGQALPNPALPSAPQQAPAAGAQEPAKPETPPADHK